MFGIGQRVKVIKIANRDVFGEINGPFVGRTGFVKNVFPEGVVTVQFPNVSGIAPERNFWAAVGEIEAV